MSICRFVSKVGAGQTTFNHNPDDLNFAFLGKMWFIFSGNGLVNERFDIDKTMLAQGRSGTSNNWWFGGESCEVCGGPSCPRDTVNCLGYDERGQQVVWGFQRGTQNGLNELTMYPFVGRPVE